MSRLLALFPLQIVVFPGERLPLHIFEMRYRELVQDCEEENITFGIPTFIKGKLGYGTEVRMEKIMRRYETGEFDIVCDALGVFKIDEFYNPLHGKMYAGADVVFLENIDDGMTSQKQIVIELICQLYMNIGVAYEPIDTEFFDSFLYAHKVGLNLEQEYKLLQLTRESERLHYLKNHLEHIIPIVKQVNKTKEIIQLNGHFKNFDPLDFKDLKF